MSTNFDFYEELLKEHNTDYDIYKLRKNTDNIDFDLMTNDEQAKYRYENLKWLNTRHQVNQQLVIIGDTSMTLTNQKKVKVVEPDIFEELWKLYPNKKGKAQAYKSYKKAIKKGTKNAEIEQGIYSYIFYIKKTKTDVKFVKHGSTWFYNQCWEDDNSVSGNKTAFDMLNDINNE